MKTPSKQENPSFTDQFKAIGMKYLLYPPMIFNQRLGNIYNPITAKTNIIHMRLLSFKKNSIRPIAYWVAARSLSVGLHSREITCLPRPADSHMGWAFSIQPLLNTLFYTLLHILFHSLKQDCGNNVCMLTTHAYTFLSWP